MNMNNTLKLILYWLPSILFNIVETIIVFTIGIFMKVSVVEILYGMIVFQIVRQLVKEDKHYKNVFKCLLWSTLVFISIFLLSKINILFYTIGCAFSAYILSGKADVQKDEESNKNKKENVGMYLWKRSIDDSKYKFIEEYIQENENSERIKDFEEALNNIDSEYYKIYKLRFYDNRTLKYIANELNISSTARVTEKLDNIQNILLGYVQGNKKELIKK